MRDSGCTKICYFDLGSAEEPAGVAEAGLAEEAGLAAVVGFFLLCFFPDLLVVFLVVSVGLSANNTVVPSSIEAPSIKVISFFIENLLEALKRSRLAAPRSE